METARGTVPCSKTPPFFLKSGLPDHRGVLAERERQEREREREKERDRENTLR